MGQIVSSAAKPKRCNANQLSQVPTPAAGEHILVSSDNSMNAAGQGNFDCYIVGVGTTAATALELHKIDGGVYDAVFGINQQVTTQYTIAGYIKKSDGSIVTNNTWIHSELIPIDTFVSVTKLWNHSSVAQVAYYNSSGVYISGQNGLPATVTMADLTIPTGTAFIAFSTDSSNATLNVTTLLATDGLVSQIEKAIMVVPQQFTDAQKEQAQKNIGIGGSTSTATTSYNLEGYIRKTDGVVVTGGTWIHSDYIPVDDFVSGEKFYSHSSVAQVAYFNSNKQYISGQNGFPNYTISKEELTIPAGTAYLVFSTDASHYTLSITTTETLPSLIERVSALEEDMSEIDISECVKTSAQTFTIAEQQQVQANIGINKNRYVHYSIDDSILWAELIVNENSYTSIFDNEKFARLKLFHDTYGVCVTLNCFIVATINDVEYSISNVPTKFQSEFQANKDWLRFAFHGTDTTELFTNIEPSVLKGYYDTFVAGIFRMTGDYKCIDRVTRLSSFTGNLQAVLAIRDTDCGITGLLTNDRNIELSVGSSYYLSANANAYMHNHCKMYDADNLLYFIRSQTRIENANYNNPSLLGTKEYANFSPIIELFWHETVPWTGSSFYLQMQSYAEFLESNGYANAFSADILRVD